MFHCIQWLVASFLTWHSLHGKPAWLAATSRFFAIMSQQGILYTIEKENASTFLNFFLFFSRALPRKCITGALANSGLPLIHRRRFGERLCRHPFSACPLRIEFHTITLTARSNRMPRKAHSPQRQPKLLIASQSYLAPITFQRYLIVHKQINKIVFRQSHQNSWKTIC